MLGDVAKEEIVLKGRLVDKNEVKLSASLN
jgi:hypothetical protein